jgi:hypothetical protein
MRGLEAAKISGTGSRERVVGLTFWIMGVQGRRTADGRAVVQLRTFRDVNGLAKPAVVIAEELREPLVDAVLEFLAEEGPVRRKLSDL